MSTTAIAQTTEKTHIWLNEIAEQLDWDDDDLVFRALRTVLHQLRDRLPINESAQLASQLPMLVRGMYYENWDPQQHPQRIDAEMFAEHVAAAFPGDYTIDPIHVVRSVLVVLGKHVSPGEVEDVKLCLPDDYRVFWE
jgi:uncharacterized protein (DUF2267 family)